jgi:hypothetical protein
MDDRKTQDARAVPRPTRREELIRERLQVEEKLERARQTDCGGCRGRKITR